MGHRYWCSVREGAEPGQVPPENLDPENDDGSSTVAGTATEQNTTGTAGGANSKSDYRFLHSGSCPYIFFSPRDGYQHCSWWRSWPCATKSSAGCTTTSSPSSWPHYSPHYSHDDSLPKPEPEPVSESRTHDHEWRRLWWLGRSRSSYSRPSSCRPSSHLLHFFRHRKRIHTIRFLQFRKPKARADAYGSRRTFWFVCVQCYGWSREGAVHEEPERATAGVPRGIDILLFFFHGSDCWSLRRWLCGWS